MTSFEELETLGPGGTLGLDMSIDGDVGQEIRKESHEAVLLESKKVGRSVGALNPRLGRGLGPQSSRLFDGLIFFFEGAMVAYGAAKWRKKLVFIAESGFMDFFPATRWSWLPPMSEREEVQLNWLWTDSRIPRRIKPSCSARDYHLD